MVDIQEKRGLAPSTKQFVGERTIPLGDLVQLKRAFDVAPLGTGVE